MGRRYDTVSLLTDYGHVDELAGVLHAVVRDIAAHVTVIDLTHDIPAFDVRAGALALARAIGYLPEGVVVAVVDPGVGTDRRGVAIEVAGGAGVLIGPDNGLLAPAAAVVGGAERAVELTEATYQLAAPGATFAGRDVFAPSAAHLCNGVELDALGPQVDPALLVPGIIPLPRREGDELRADVLWVDRFGNCQLNVASEDLDDVTGGSPDPVAVVVGEDRHVARRATTFADLGPGSLGLVVDSHGMLQLALDRRSAAVELGVAAGDQVVLVALDDGAGVTTAVEMRAR